jgi:hypothetical protein
MRKLVYTAINPVKDGLVERVHQWPGVNGLGALLRQRPVEAYRPRHFFAAKGRMPPSISLSYSIPKGLGDTDQFLQTLRELVEAEEDAILAVRRQTGGRVLGRRAILDQSWKAVPNSSEPRRSLRPRIAAKNPLSRIEEIQRERDFILCYREARARWIAGEPIPFPVGTYWLRRFARVPMLN